MSWLLFRLRVVTVCLSAMRLRAWQRMFVRMLGLLGERRDDTILKPFQQGVAVIRGVCVQGEDIVRNEKPGHRRAHSYTDNVACLTATVVLPCRSAPRMRASV